MAGIVSYGVYVPWYRLGPGSNGWTASGERSVANFDEDSITMAVAAARNCLGPTSRDGIGALYFASTTAPYREKSNASVVAVASDLPSDIFITDFANTLRAGTNALKAAIDAARGSSAKQILVTASDLRVAQPRSEWESVFGDGAAAFLIGDTNVIAEVEDCCSISHEMLDVWKEENDKFTRSWEDRFIAEEGYLKLLPQAVSTLMKKHNLKPKDFTKAVFYAPDLRRHREMVKKLGFAEAQVQDPLLNSVGNTGTASAMIALAAALEQAKAGDRILMANYGDGADAFIFRVTREIETARKPRHGIKDYLTSKKLLPSYETYLAWRGLINRAAPVRRPPFRTPSPSALLREVDKNVRFQGSKCTKCGYPQYPPQAICTKCHAKDSSEPYSFADKQAKIFTYTMDTLAPTLDPPMVVAVINFDGGGRAYSVMTDRDAGKIAIGMPVEMTFRCIYTSEGIHNYFWRCMPVR
ncbi:MAG: 3-oxoacyl-[acyl-carrier-protein] synthase III C-terminal domain-containing protein [Dehalococcoidia bacterium]